MNAFVRETVKLSLSIPSDSNGQYVIVTSDWTREIGVHEIPRTKSGSVRSI